MVPSLRIPRPLWGAVLLVGTTVAVLLSLGIAPGPGLFSDEPGATLTVRAKGSVGDEEMVVRVAGTDLATFVVGSDWKEYQIETPSAAGAPDVEIAFVNDRVRPRDRNLTVDWVRYGDTTYQAEADTTFSTGVWANGGFCTAGYFSHEMLACNGTFAFGDLPGADLPPTVADDAAGTTIVVSAAGNVGAEMLELLVDGRAVTVFQLDASANLYNNPTFTDFKIRLGQDISVDQIGFAFVNDRYEPGVDYNVRLGSVTVGDETYGADYWELAPMAWTNRSLCEPSWDHSNVLACNAELTVANGTTSVPSQPEPLTAPGDSSIPTVPTSDAPTTEPVSGEPTTRETPKPTTPVTPIPTSPPTTALPTTPVPTEPTTAPSSPPTSAAPPVTEPVETTHAQPDPATDDDQGGHPITHGASAYESIRNDDPKFSQFANVPSNQLSIDALTFTPDRPDNGSVGDGQFRASCEYSHFASDDPIVYPGQPGQAHLHMFFGNTLTNAHTTTDSLVNSGGSTCNGFELNRSAYWTPALLDGKGNAIVPDSIILYYKTKQPGQVQRMPQGLKMIAGNTGHGSFTPNQNLHWSCGGSGVSYNQSNQIPNCNGDTINAVIVFPNCWDGRNLDSSDHKSHLTYVDENRSCPGSHPVRLPQISILLYFPGASSVDGWHISSDRHNGNNAAPGSSLHADWFGGWNDETMDLWVDGCMKAARNCSYGQTGTNRQLAKLNGRQEYEGPNFLPLP